MCAIKYFLGDVLSMTDTNFNNHRVLLINDEPFIVVYNTDKGRTLENFLENSTHSNSNVSVLYGQVHSNRIVFSAISYDQHSKGSKNYFSMSIETPPNLFSTDDAMQLRFKFIDNSLGNKRFVKKHQSFNMHNDYISGSCHRDACLVPTSEQEPVNKSKVPKLSVIQIDALVAQFRIPYNVASREPEPVEKTKEHAVSVDQIDALSSQFGVGCTVASSDPGPVEKTKEHAVSVDQIDALSSQFGVGCTVASREPEPVEKTKEHAVSVDQDMSKLTKPELVLLCKQKKIKKYSKLNKQELIILLSSA
jgi:hypothetical protein